MNRGAVGDRAGDGPAGKISSSISAGNADYDDKSWRTHLEDLLQSLPASVWLPGISADSIPGAYRLTTLPWPVVRPLTAGVSLASPYCGWPEEGRGAVRGTRQEGGEADTGPGTMSGSEASTRPGASGTKDPPEPLIPSADRASTAARAATAEHESPAGSESIAGSETTAGSHSASAHPLPDLAWPLLFTVPGQPVPVSIPTDVRGTDPNVSAWTAARIAGAVYRAVLMERSLPDPPIAGDRKSADHTPSTAAPPDHPARAQELRALTVIRYTPEYLQLKFNENKMLVRLHEDADERRLEAFLASRRYRRETWPEAVAYEEATEMQEGVAAYLADRVLDRLDPAGTEARRQARRRRALDIRRLIPMHGVSRDVGALILDMLVRNGQSHEQLDGLRQITYGSVPLPHVLDDLIAAAPRHQNMFCISEGIAGLAAEDGAATERLMEKVLREGHTLPGGPFRLRAFDIQGARWREPKLLIQGPVQVQAKDGRILTRVAEAFVTEPTDGGLVLHATPDVRAVADFGSFA